MPCFCGLVAKSCPILLQPYGLWPARHLCPWNPPGKNTGVGSHSLLQDNLPHSGNRTRVSSIAGGSFTIWATRGVQICIAGRCKSWRVTENHLLFQERGGGAGCSPSLKWVLGISASHLSEHSESVLLFLALAKLQVVIFSQTVFFPVA